MGVSNSRTSVCGGGVIWRPRDFLPVTAQHIGNNLFCHLCQVASVRTAFGDRAVQLESLQPSTAFLKIKSFLIFLKMMTIKFSPSFG